MKRMASRAVNEQNGSFIGLLIPARGVVQQKIFRVGLIDYESFFKNRVRLPALRMKFFKNEAGRSV